MKTRALAAVCFAAALAATALLAPGASAATGTLTGTLHGIPGNADFAVAEAIDPKGRIDAVGGADSGAFSLRVPPGPYVVAASGDTETHEYEGFSPPKEVDKGAKTKFAPHLESSPLSRAAAGGGLVPKGTVFAIEGVSLDVGGSIFLPIGSLVLNDLYRACSERGMFFVDTSPKFVEFATQEKALSDAGRLAIPYDYRPLRPQYGILGSAGVTIPDNAGEPDEYDFELNLAHSNHAGVNAAATEVKTTAHGYDFDVVRELASEASLQFAKKVCG